LEKKLKFCITSWTNISSCRLIQKANKNADCFLRFLHIGKRRIPLIRQISFQMSTKDGREIQKRSTAGSNFEIEWKDSTTSWLPMKEVQGNKYSGFGKVCERE
jgi:hypothetical protein